MITMLLVTVPAVWLAAESGALEQLSPLTQAGVLVGLLFMCLVALRAVFNLAMKAKDEQISNLKDQVKVAEASATDRVKAAEERASRYETKLEEQQQRMQTEVLRVLGEATSTTRRALEITRGSHDDR